MGQSHLHRVVPTDTEMMERELKEIGYDAAKLPLGKLSKSVITKAYAVLKAIETALENAEKRKEEARKEKEKDSKGSGGGSKRRRGSRKRGKTKSALNDEEFETEDIAHLSSRYYTLIPHEFGRQRPPLINNRKLLNKEMKLVLPL